MTMTVEPPAGTPCVKTGRYAILEQFVADGVDPHLRQPRDGRAGLPRCPGRLPVAALHPDPAGVGRDHGGGRLRPRREAPAIAQIHSSPGLGNAIGAIYQAKRGHSPLVVIGGDAGIKYQAMDAQMAADLVSMAKPVTKWSTMVQHPSSLLRVLRRAFKIAATPPMGPVYVCLPQDVMDAPVAEEVFPTSLPITRLAAGAGAGRAGRRDAGRGRTPDLLRRRWRRLVRRAAGAGAAGRDCWARTSGARTPAS